MKYFGKLIIHFCKNFSVLFIWTGYLKAHFPPSRRYPLLISIVSSSTITVDVEFFGQKILETNQRIPKDLKNKENLLFAETKNVVQRIIPNETLLTSCYESTHLESGRRVRNK